MKNKRVLITGAASGIGRATAIRFAGEGFAVCASDIQENKLASLEKELPGEGHLFFLGSYADASSVNTLENGIVEHWGSLDVLVNCAGVSQHSDPFGDITAWRKVFDLMVNGCIMISAAAVRLMPGGGRIIHITSIHGERAERGSSSYAMAKSAINQYCRSAAVELAGKNILVNAIAPGFVNTPMSLVDGKSELESAWFIENYIKGNHLPLKRAAEPEEIAGVAFFLAGKDASYITGQVITVDGGLTITF
jgi:NAD(P)-dependent dehydrogenase (short-subunit alcohol dehydrogenase family)